VKKKLGTITRGSKLLCPECGDLKEAKSPKGDEIVLLCGHIRPQILPLTDGRVSLEHLNTERGKNLFPASHDDEVTSQKPWSEKRK